MSDMLACPSTKLLFQFLVMLYFDKYNTLLYFDKYNNSIPNTLFYEEQVHQEK